MPPSPNRGRTWLCGALPPLVTCHTAAADAQFKQISVAYQILSDPKTRRQYNEFGQKNGGGGGDGEAQIDPEEVFGQMFGGVRFEDLIGTISIGALTSPHSH